MSWNDLPTEEKNHLIAEKVTQWTPVICDAVASDIFFQNDGQRVRAWCSKCGYQDKEGIPTTRTIHWRHAVPMPNYVEDMNAAWLVVEKMSAIPTQPWKGELPPSVWFMRYFEKAWLWACSAHGAANEICSAALRALGALDEGGKVGEEEV